MKICPYLIKEDAGKNDLNRKIWQSTRYKNKFEILETSVKHNDDRTEELMTIPQKTALLVSFPYPADLHKWLSSTCLLNTQFCSITTKPLL